MMQTASLLSPELLCAHVGIAPGMRVADIGCGSHGWLVHHAAHLVGEEGQVYAVDVRPEVLPIIARAGVMREPPTPIETIWSDIEHYGGTGIPAFSLDRIFLVNVVSELSDIPSALRECDRLLAPEGKILVVDWGHSTHPLAPALPVPPEIIARAAQEVSSLAVGGMVSCGNHHYGIILSHT
ncbi:hypothetical protein A3H75_03395 [Candidatus Uhrbacteria bacterium RIFCSPLOWO2_02_FULL_51_9]|uniref:Methyltransferase type 11 domain-containing protein n=1 Tax=Candidatus Uhrbacteria bacterium RIFCSPLOWO2_02_FULL_51_9 TaxID=1802410 RepID=A0A1F7VCX7_9BACT|nr:MAG: hypothetical protein A3H75_03395 [Candidatus Uhrbacteria bacterium RIFCSPLOWO2_02_FULL_51_9]